MRNFAEFNSNQRLGVVLGFRHYSGSYNQQKLMANSGNGALIYELSGIVTFTTGIFLTLVRLFEPLFKLLVYK